MAEAAEVAAQTLRSERSGLPRLVRQRIMACSQPAAPLSALVNEMIVSAQAKFGSGADHTEMAKLCELLAGSVLEAG